MADRKKTSSGTISVVLSFFNEEDVLDELIERLVAVFKAEACPYELIFVNDASTDRSLTMLQAYSEQNKAIKIVNMSRNFGVSECVLAGMRYATGDAVVYMDTDLQDPPEVIPELIAKWRDGADLVYTRRLGRDGEPQYKLVLTKIAYNAINRISEIELPIEAGDFRLLSRQAVDKLLDLPEMSPYMRGMTQWIGFERAEVTYRRAPRAGGETHFPVFSRGPIKTFFDGLTSFSMFPLYAVFIVGIIGIASGFAGLVISGVSALFGANAATAGWVFFALSLWGGLMTGVGVACLYIARIYRDVRGRPRYIVKDTVNL